jgi:hypothetical protein
VVATLEQTMHETAVRALAQQEAALEALRARTGTLLTASSLVASFLGGQGIARNGLTIWIVAALSAFAAVALLSVYVLLPKALYFSLDVTAAYESLATRADDEQAIHALLARWLQERRAVNKPIIARTVRAARFAGAALAAEIVLLGVGLA